MRAPHSERSLVELRFRINCRKPSMGNFWLILVIVTAIAGVLSEAQGATKKQKVASKAPVKVTAKPVAGKSAIAKPVKPVFAKSAQFTKSQRVPTQAKAAPKVIPLRPKPAPLSRPVTAPPVPVVVQPPVPTTMKSSDIFLQGAPSVHLIGVGNSITGTGFAVGPQLIATLFQNVSESWDESKKVFFEIQGQKYPSQILSVDVANNLALVKAPVALGAHFARTNPLQKSACVYGIGYTEKKQLEISSQTWERKQWGGPCFDEAGQFVGLLSGDGVQTARNASPLAQLLAEQNKAPASVTPMPTWKTQVIAQIQTYQEQVLAKVRNFPSYHQSCEAGPAPAGFFQFSTWISLRCRPEGGLVWSDQQKVAQVDWQIFDARNPNALTSPEVQPQVLFEDWSRQLPAKVSPNCHKSVVNTQLGLADLHLCSVSFARDMKSRSTFLQWTLKDESRPFSFAMSLQGFDEKATRGLIVKVGQMLRRAE